MSYISVDYLCPCGHVGTQVIEINPKTGKMSPITCNGCGHSLATMVTMRRKGEEYIYTGNNDLPRMR